MNFVWRWRLAAAGACLSFAVGLAHAAQPVPPGWREFAIPAGKFSVLMPGTPKTTRQKIRTEIGDVAATRYTTIDAANVTYDVLLNDYPKAGVARANPQKLLDSVRDGLVYQTKGRLVSEKRITLANLPGRDEEIAGANGIHYRVRLVWAGTRLYQIMTVTPGKPRPDANIFFDSFKLTGTP
jgi:hypothetical protein